MGAVARPNADPRPLVGRRVSLRYRLSGGRPGARYSDAVGDLDRHGDRWLVHTRRGPVVVDPADVVAVRAVPPPRPRRAPLGAVTDLERVCAEGWPAPVIEPLGDWRLRAAGGFSMRANSALAVGDPGLAVPDALAEVRRFATRHGIAARVQVAQSTPWEATIQRAGWVADDTGPVSVRVARLAELGEASHGEAEIEMATAPSPEWWRLAAGTSRPCRSQRAVLLGGVVGFGLARTDGEAVGALRAALVGDWLHLSRLAVEPALRNQGLGTALTIAACGWAQQRGAVRGVLQVLPHNTAADRLYAGLGFTEHHRYRYWLPPCE